MPHYPLSNCLLRLSEYDGFKKKEEKAIFLGLMTEYASLLDTQYEPIANKDGNDQSLCAPSDESYSDLKKLVLNDDLFIGNSS